MRYRYLIYILLLLPVFIFRDYTPDNELKYISIADEALRNGNIFTFCNHGEVYADKPPLYFWIIMLSRLITGDYYPAIIGLFSLLPAIGILIVTDKWFRSENIKHDPVISNLMLLTTVLFTGGALVIRQDMLMTFFIILSSYTFYRIYTNKNKKYETLLLPVWIFLGVFSKGAMGILIPLASITAFLILKKQIKTFGRYFGLKQWSILIGLCVLWFLPVYLEGGNEYLNNILFKQTVGRGINSFHHKEPFWYYFPRMLWSFAPWSLLYIALIWQGVRKHLIDNDVLKFFSTGIVVNIIILSFISAKLDIYMLPIYPFVTYLCSALLSKNEKTTLNKIMIAGPAIIPASAFPLSFILVKKIPYEYNNLTFAYIGLFALFAGCIASLILLKKNKISSATGAIASGMLAMLFTASFAIPQFNQYIGLKSTAEAAKRTAEANKIDSYACYKFRSASDMDVFLGKTVKYLDSTEQIDSLENLPRKSILFMRNKDIAKDENLKDQLDKKNLGKDMIGEYTFFVLGKEK